MVRRGRPPKLSPAQQQHALRMWDTGDYTIRQIATEFAVDPQTVSRIIRRNRPRTTPAHGFRPSPDPIERLAKALTALTRAHARKRGYEFLLTTDEVRDLIVSPCTYCGLAPENYHHDSVTGQPLYYTGIDRVNNLKNYEAGNVVPCCWRCNRAKHTDTAEEFLTHCIRVVEFQRAKAAQTDAGTTPPGPTNGS